MFWGSRAPPGGPSMATVQEPRPASRHDAFVETQLARARGRIRACDVAVAALGLVSGTLAFGLLMLLVDRTWVLPAGIRQTAFIGFLVGAAVYAVVALALFLYLRPAQFFSLLGRAFAPFGQKAIATRTRITLVRPPEGHLTVPINTSVEIRVSVEGRVPSPDQPDALRLRFRYNPDDPASEDMPLVPATD